jgi:hypothetical protein
VSVFPDDPIEGSATLSAVAYHDADGDQLFGVVDEPYGNETASTAEVTYRCETAESAFTPGRRRAVWPRDRPVRRR